MKTFGGKVAVVTGATSGLALASAKRFVEEGALVFITGRRNDVLNKAVKEIGRNVVGVQGDAASLEGLDRLFAEGTAQKGHIAILFASAGVAEMDVPIGPLTEAHFGKAFDLTVRGTL